MNHYRIKMDISCTQAEDVRIIINNTEYALTPVIPASTSRQAPTFVDYVNRLSKELTRHGRYRTSETYRSAMRSLLRFLPQPDIAFHQIDAPLIDDYERHLKLQGITNNSISFYMRVLRTIYNRAVAQGYTPDRQPFAHAYTGIGKTDKRAINLDTIRQLSCLQGLTRHELLARDLFLFSLYTRGMSFIDMAYLRPANISNGILTYRRHKTGQALSMRWEPQMQDIVDRHPSPNPDYLLPIIKHSNGHERSQYRERQRMVNAMLKSIARQTNIIVPLTMYVARHSWASIAHTMGLPLKDISEGMGHTSERTTQIYLKSLDPSRIDTMNANIIRAVSPSTIPTLTSSRTERCG